MPQCIRLNLLGRPVDIEGEHITLVHLWWLQALKLGVHQIAPREMPLPRRGSPREDLLGGVEVDEADAEVARLLRALSQDVAVVALERSTRHDEVP